MRFYVPDDDVAGLLVSELPGRTVKADYGDETESDIIDEAVLAAWFVGGDIFATTNAFIF